VFFSVANVERYLTDRGIEGERRKELLDKAKFFSKRGLFTGDRLENIFVESGMIEDFLVVVQLNPNHKKILETALQKAA